MGKLGKLKRLKIFDSPDTAPLDYGQMLKPGRVSILDLSDTDSPQINNSGDSGAASWGAGAAGEKLQNGS